VHIDDHIIASSCATERFRDDLRRFIEAHEDVSSIVLLHRAPRVKVLRVIHHLLETHPEFVVERVAVDGRSGCSDFVGTVTVDGGGESRTFEFAWDCRWRAEQEGWTDCFGFPDQIRAAEAFRWRCFARWEPVHQPDPAVAPRRS
jgi:hypothetical protein